MYGNQRGLCSTWTCLHHRGLSCTWTCMDNMSLYCSLTVYTAVVYAEPRFMCLQYKALSCTRRIYGPVLLLDGLHYRGLCCSWTIYTPEAELHLDNRSQHCSWTCILYRGLHST